MFKNKKVIGITGPSVWSHEVHQMVLKKLQAIPVFIHQDSSESLEYVVSQIDGLILAGGVDIFPGFYGCPVTEHDDLTKFDIRRDAREKALIGLCIAAKKPIFAICRGFQMIGIYHGFVLVPNLNGYGIAHSPGEIKIDLEDGGFMHYIKPLTNSAKERFFGKEKQIGVNSFHHQGVLAGVEVNCRNGLQVLAVSDVSLTSKNNFTIAEIAEKEEHKIIGCQFHPEADWEYGNVISNKVIERFIEFLG